MQSLPRLLAGLQPSHVIEHVERTAAAVLAGFTLNNLRPNGEGALLLQLARLEHELRFARDGTWRPFPAHARPVYERLARQRLQRLFGPQGVRAATRTVRIGADGGMRRLLQRYVDDFVRHRSRALILRQVRRYWSSLAPMDRGLAWRHFYLHLGKVLPAGVKLHPSNISDLPRLLAMYPQLIDELRQLSIR
jgi:hypothetical protein